MNSEAKERPILFSGPMVRAILEGRKTMTRRVVKPQPPLDEFGYPAHGTIRGPEYFEPAAYDRNGEMQPGPEIYGVYDDDGEWGIKCPYGKPGDRLWVRETFQICSNYHVDCRDTTPPHSDGRPTLMVDDPEYPSWQQCYYRATDKCPELLDVDTDEMIQRWRPSIHMPRWACRLVLEVTAVRVERLHDISVEDAISEGVVAPDGNSIQCFRLLWSDIHSRDSWNSNPWVWVIEFKRVEQANEQ
jgi:hypothetical protein